MATAKSRPRQGTHATRKKLLDAAGALLSEVGMERISTNMICARAGLTPPALYYYFPNKYEVVTALGERLMKRQSAVLLRWIDRHAAGRLDGYAEHVGELLLEMAAITEAEPGGIWIERALHSTVKLIHLRAESRRYVSDRLTRAFAQLLPGVPRQRIWQRVRLTVEFGYAAIELLHSDSGVERDVVVAETAQMLRAAFEDLVELRDALAEAPDQP